jgi:hypothetical protein
MVATTTPLPVASTRLVLASVPGQAVHLLIGVLYLRLTLGRLHNKKHMFELIKAFTLNTGHAKPLSPLQQFHTNFLTKSLRTEYY